MPTSKFHEPVDRDSQVSDHPVESGFEIEYQTCIDQILAARSPVHMTCRRCICLAYFGDQSPDERLGNFAECCCLVRERCNIEMFGTRSLLDRVECSGGNCSDSRLRARQCHFEVQHALYARAIAQDLAHRRTRNEG